MKYSVLMSVYKKDNPEFLKVALESIYEKQTRKPDEIVIVFDGALNDELYKVLDDFKKDKEDVVCYYPQEINRGLGEALAIGAEKCTGDYIFRMDSDDISLPDRFEKQSAYIENHPEIDVLGGCIAEFKISPENEELRFRVCPKTHTEIMSMGKKRSPMNHVSVCIKTSALIESGNYEGVLLLEDYYLWMKMVSQGYRLENMEDVLVYARADDGFEQRRKAAVRIKGWQKLQKLMLQADIICKREALMNMIYITGFTYCPAGVKKVVYDKFLRKKDGIELEKIEKDDGVASKVG